MPTIQTDGGGKLFCGMSGRRDFVDPTTAAPVNAPPLSLTTDGGVDESLIFRGAPPPPPVFSDEQIQEACRRIDDLSADAACKFFVLMEKQRWEKQIPSDPKVEMLYRLISILNFLDMISPEMTPTSEEEKK